MCLNDADVFLLQQAQVQFVRKFVDVALKIDCIVFQTQVHHVHSALYLGQKRLNQFVKQGSEGYVAQTIVEKLHIRSRIGNAGG